MKYNSYIEDGNMNNNLKKIKKKKYNSNQNNINKNLKEVSYKKNNNQIKKKKKNNKNIWNENESLFFNKNHIEKEININLINSDNEFKNTNNDYDYSGNELEKDNEKEDGNDDDEDDDEGVVEDKRILRRLDLKSNDKILHKYPCSILWNFNLIQSVFIICKSNFYIITNYTISETKEFFEIGEVGKVEHKCRKFDYQKLIHIIKRKKFSDNIGIEFFFKNENTCLVIFTDQIERDLIFKNISSKSKNLINLQPKKNPNFYKNSVNITTNNSEQQIIDQDELNQIKEFKTKNMTLKWALGEISNFKYLMYLNTIAGRSFNDLSRYPVFPWILKDYTSNYLDLTNREVFRDLSKPMGAQTENRLKSFVSNYENWVDEYIPKFFYGSHYSNPGIILSFLVRVEPFAEQFVELQSGKFDHPRRMFRSLDITWENSSFKSSANVKELIPEFYYLPEMFLNANKFDFGKLEETEEIINNVNLPPWSKGSSYEFVRLMRAALESDYVSEHLNDWIDLIFGYKQRGEEAVKANNLFYYLTYENYLNLNKITDLQLKQTLITQIENFGQCPIQLFHRPHPKKKILIANNNKNFLNKNGIFSNLKNLNFQIFKELNQNNNINDNEDEDPNGNKNGNESNGNENTNQNNYNDDQMNGYYNNNNDNDNEVRIQDLKIIENSSNKMEDIINTSQKQIFIVPKNKTMIDWNYIDNSIRIIKIKDKKILSIKENPHNGKIQIAKISKNGEFFLTAGQDLVIKLWAIIHNNNVKKNHWNPEIKLIQIFTGHSKEITTIDICLTYSIFVSGSKDKTCIIYDLNKKRKIRTLSNFKLPITVVKINHVNGNILTCSSNILQLFTINGKLLAFKNLRKYYSNKITCALIKRIDKNFDEFVYITGHESGSLTFWRLISSINPNYDYKSKSHLNIKNQKRVNDFYFQEMWKTKSFDQSPIFHIVISKNNNRLYFANNKMIVCISNQNQNTNKNIKSILCSKCQRNLIFNSEKLNCSICKNPVCGNCSRIKSEKLSKNRKKIFNLICNDCYFKNLNQNEVDVNKVDQEIIIEK
ncbi:beige/beach-related [Anaeramoeba flamelloides]|uniref:Beige/beach-related n=1 Tax=Anaeramoeba flamelloides TaxID=1746091 RepID=A0AAV7YHM9_9EUKA|nr:beige/beach-related [Anaeramoeba flamelloides]